MPWEPPSRAGPGAGLHHGRAVAAGAPGRRAARASTAQAATPGSPLELYRALLALRRATPALHAGTYRPSTPAPDVFAFVREHEGSALLVGAQLRAVPAAAARGDGRGAAVDARRPVDRRARRRTRRGSSARLGRSTAAAATRAAHAEPVRGVRRERAASPAARARRRRTGRRAPRRRRRGSVDLDRRARPSSWTATIVEPVPVAAVREHGRRARLEQRRASRSRAPGTRAGGGSAARTSSAASPGRAAARRR